MYFLNFSQSGLITRFSLDITDRISLNIWAAEVKVVKILFRFSTSADFF